MYDQDACDSSNDSAADVYCISATIDIPRKCMLGAMSDSPVILFTILFEVLQTFCHSFSFVPF